MGRKQPIEIAVETLYETDQAWKLFDGIRTEWVPKSQVKYNGGCVYTMPEWLAKQKGFI